MDGRCTCGEVTYRLTDKPLFVHCCHCTWCQRETGSAFAVNSLIEMDRFEVEGRTVAVHTPSESGLGQIVHRCPTCHVALWSHYPGMGEDFAFVRSGTMAVPGAYPPDIHIFTESKQPWVALDGRVPVMEQYYRRSVQWPDWALERRQKVIDRGMDRTA